MVSQEFKVQAESYTNLIAGCLIASQLLDVAIRVPTVRQFAVTEMINLLDCFSISSQSDSMYEVLYAAAFIIGEFSGLVTHFQDPPFMCFQLKCFQ